MKKDLQYNNAEPFGKQKFKVNSLKALQIFFQVFLKLNKIYFIIHYLIINFLKLKVNI